MTDESKNIITNILSIPCMGGVVYEYLNDKDWMFMTGFFVAGLSLIVFKASKTRYFLTNLFNKITQ